MTREIVIPELKGYLYDLEYRVLAKFFPENLAEQA